MDTDLSVVLAEITRKLDMLTNLPQQVEDVKASIQLMSQKYDDILSRQVSQEKELTSLKKKVSKLEENANPSDIQQLKASVNDLEWRSRKLNVEVHGIPVTDNENLITKLNEVAKLVSLSELSATDVEAVHRLPSRQGKVPGIIVRFSQLSLRDRWIEKRKVLRNMRSDISICENMTVQNRKLLRDVREWATANDYRFAWHANGKVLVRKQENESVVVIRCMTDLDKLSST